MPVKEKESTGALALGCLGIIAASAIHAPLRAWVFIKIYDWHVRPVFGGPHWSVPQVWALLIFVGLVIDHPVPDTKTPERPPLEIAGRLIVKALFPLLSLLIAWCLK